MAQVRVVSRWQGVVAPALWKLITLGALAPLLFLIAAATISDAYDLRHGAVTSGVVSAVDGQGAVTVTFVSTTDDSVSCDTTHVQNDPGVDAQVEVHYDPDDPEGTCAVGNAGQSYVPGILLVTLGAGLSAAFLVLLRTRRRRFKNGGGADVDDDGWTEGW